MSAADARTVLDDARQQHLRAIQSALRTGVPITEFLEDAASFGAAVGQLIALQATAPLAKAAE